MEHEVFVPVPAERLGEVLADPERAAGAVPGFQQDAGAEPGAGRLKVRVGGHSITYRGAFTLRRRDDGSYALQGEATEARGSGTVRLALTVRLRPAEDGTTLTFGGTATGDGRIAELPEETVASAGARLLTRFAESAARAAAAGRSEDPAPAGAEGPASGTKPPASGAEPPASGTKPPASGAEPPASGAKPSAPGTEPPAAGSKPPAADSEPSAAGNEPPPADSEPSAAGNEPPAPDSEPAAPGTESSSPSPSFPSASDAEVPDLPEIPDSLETPADAQGGPGDAEAGPPAEAAHARRTMIGRSAEEVDHAPPRGRYAPVPAPEATASAGVLRWAAPAAAVVLASAIVVNRVLRKRR
ncbi:SRPBCC family protein [Streptomyces sp. ME02-6978.2a]|uniref:SRPBCC family protein n=1 Tax=Streptomyces sp. ME02-6978.2a TaxID=462922 RepID=UPI0029AB335A|nr:SRPBCC family protein [Streptomyces sp. ME02-6978.2a]MDX3361116.1 carbon monoxide dehydrogenase [Streptomyces sp. ME02-6978.2a]